MCGQAVARYKLCITKDAYSGVHARQALHHSSLGAQGAFIPSHQPSGKHHCGTVLSLKQWSKTMHDHAAARASIRSEFAGQLQGWTSQVGKALPPPAETGLMSGIREFSDDLAIAPCIACTLMAGEYDAWSGRCQMLKYPWSEDQPSWPYSAPA